ncbi:MAG TPA: 2-dehydropantoate 2-reductase [Candidatus Dormibacteraeota bacterium]|nr:2-dehydropantoate 2-reductase [Candidatus Dormibacteraeota bacterium]
MPLRHAILGAGGVGGTVGTCLAHLGDSVTVVVKPGSVATYPEQLHLESSFGTFYASVACAREVPACDVLWLAVKATQLDAAMRAIVNPDALGAIVPLLNGIDHLGVLRAKYGNDRVIAATIAGEMERVSPGHFAHRTPFLRLNVASAGKSLLGGVLNGLQKIGVECRFVDDEPTLMWSKAVFLAPIALATTAFDQPVGGVMSDPARKQLWESCVREACAVATAEGAKVDPEAVISGVPKLPPNMRSSMQKDVDQGNPPELDAIAGPILRGGRRHTIEVPATMKLVDAVQVRST